jgi:hypothetical protein
VRKLGVDYLQGHLIGRPAPLLMGQRRLAAAPPAASSEEIRFTLG